MINLSHFNPNKRFDVAQALNWCGETKIFTQIRISILEENNLKEKSKGGVSQYSMEKL